MNNSSLAPGGSTLALAFCVVVVCLLLSACKDLGEEPTPPVPVVNVALRNTETFQYPTVGGDEEGTLISTQAQHYRVSEIQRDASTNWVCVYVYQPEIGYVGTDYAELEIHTNNVGSPEYARVSKVGMSFTVTN